MSKRVLVLLATCNGERFLKEQLASIALQVGKFEISICVVDDYSSDSSLATVIGFRDYFDSVSIIPKDQFGKGPGGSFLEAIVKAPPSSTYDLILFSDQDDVWFTSKLSFAYERLMDEKLDMFCCGFLLTGLTSRAPRFKSSRSHLKHVGACGSIGPGFTYALSSVFFERVRDYVLANKEWLSSNPIVFHDWLISIFSISTGANCKYDPTIKHFYRQHAGNFIGGNRMNRLVTFTKRVSIFFSSEYWNQLRFHCKLFVSEGTMLSPRELLIPFLFGQLGQRVNAILMAMIIISAAISKSVNKQ